MADLAVTRLRNALVTKLKTIIPTNGYRTQIRDVFDPPTDPERVQQFPVINLEFTDEDQVGEHLQGNYELYDLVQECELHVYFEEDDLPLAQDKAIGDVIEWCGGDYYVADSSGDATAFNVTYAGSSRWGYEPQNGSAPNGGVTIRLRVHYRTRINNPEVIG